MNRLWKLYFLIFLIFGIHSIIKFLVRSETVEAINFLNFITFILYITPVYCYVYNRKLISSNIWSWFFYISIAFNISFFASNFTFLGDYIFLSTIKVDRRGNLLSVLLTYVLFLPIFIAIYRLSKNRFLK